jgi:hypothetical protein
LANKIGKLSSGYATWRWLSGIESKEKQWFLGLLRGRNGYQAWTTHLTHGLRNEQFLLQFESTADPWQRSRLVGEKISELRKSFLALTQSERTELAKEGETELRAGLELLGRDKRLIRQLVEIVDCPESN